MHVTPTDFRDLGRGVMDIGQRGHLTAGGLGADLKAYQEGSK